MRQKSTIVKIILLALIVIATTLVCLLRWNAWFGNSPEQAYRPQQDPHNIVMTYGHSAANERIISWRADTISKPSQLILQKPSGEQNTYIPTDTTIYSRSGYAVYYRVKINHLHPGTYKYQIMADKYLSPWYTFNVTTTDTTQFVIFGDIQDEPNGPSKELFESVAHQYPNSDFWAFVGDIIERPTDYYWQVWFKAIGDTPYQKPIVAATGNHEHLKGVIKSLDTRWTSIFGNPLNGPHRALGTSYYIDFANMRYIVIDTDGLNLFSDYTITSAWLKRTAQQSNKKWNILMLHHPIHSAGVGRENIVLNLMIRNSLNNIDLVIQGHDHTYARRTSHQDTIPCTPVFVETTSANKYYLPKVNPIDDRILSGHPVYNIIEVDSTKLDFKTYQAENHTLYDHFIITKIDGQTIVNDMAPATPEIIDLPEKYKDKNNYKIRRFNNRRNARNNKWHNQKE